MYDALRVVEPIRQIALRLLVQQPMPNDLDLDSQPPVCTENEYKLFFIKSGSFVNDGAN